MVTITFQTTLRRTLGLSKVQVEIEHPCTLDKLFSICESQIGQKFYSQLLDKDGRLSHGMVLLNGRNVLMLQNIETIINSGDELIIFPLAGGG
ncbi:MoaD/ThiS family protein [Desulfovibrio litoralis]|uniref:Molybdopterin synthase sulfur carrier subunit n=1 Tax=Desulfovibrio litoralis DSM 11393 TaxID=1121455 RepID=A0A1M7RYB7_9BACT|nr:MoaD/ThiS family protein [Desulfovibrio litoralis]SHN51329.1 molybdopterin synthase sulfur carrier subunit [Desulfovibrio litoralis DSM 11393]